MQDHFSIGRRLGILLFCALVAARRGGAQGTLLAESPSGEIRIENCLRINDAEDQFGPAIYGDALIYVARNRKGRYDPRTGKPYFGLFSAPVSSRGLPQRGRSFSEELTSNYNEGPVSFANDDRVIYFTRTHLDYGTTVEDRAGRANLGIYSAYRAEYDWAAVRSLPFNGNDFSNQHPSLTPDARRIYFSSSREGGYGGLDLYFSDFRDGQWGPAINLGPDVNTEQNEAFPFIHPSGRLFFASTGHGGRGGYDLYMIDVSQRRWGKLFNLPPPINSGSDDISLVLTADGTRGYLASSRPGGAGGDDIYLIGMDNGLASLEGPTTDGERLTVYDGATSRRVAGAEVWISELDHRGQLPAGRHTFALRPPGAPTAAPTLEAVPRPLGEVATPARRTASDGSLRLELTEGKQYELTVFQPGFAPASFRFAYGADGPSRPLAITLIPDPCIRLSGRITAAGGAGLANVDLTFQAQDCPRQAPLTVRTDLAGFYELCLPATECNYEITTERRGYQPVTAHVTADQLRQLSHPRLGLVLNPVGNVRRRENEARGAILPLPGIAFYDRGPFLVDQPHYDIDLLAELLRLRPDLSISLLGHASGQESPAALLSLSEARTESVREALLRRGVAPARVTTVGYGGQYPLFPCAPCTEEHHRTNTRMEARIEIR